MLWAVVIGAVVVAGAAAAVLARRDQRSGAAPATTRDGSMADMPGMEGMAMGGGGTVRLTAGQLRQFGVTFGTVEERELTAAVRTSGMVTVDERRVATVAPRFGGYVERLLVETTGQAVRRGQPLATVYSPEVLAAAEELLVARRLAGTLSADGPGVPAAPSDLVAAARRRLTLMGVSGAEIDAVLRSGRASPTVTLRAPASGVVLEKRVTEGQAIGAGEPLYTLADLSVVWVEAELREGDAVAARVGTAADVELPGEPGRSLKGRITFLAPTADATSRTVRARVEVANADGRLRPGAYATVRLTTPTRRALTVPATAVVRTGERAIVFVDMGGGELMPHDVTTGRVSGEYVEVLSGVDRGHRVVTSAQYLLESESNLADVMRAMMGQTGSAEMGGMPGMEDMPGMDAKGAHTKGMPSAAAPAPRR
ncbi:PTS cellobiose transporter subunit IIB [Roseisolibacter agri]|uniref:PTS cellobiose transporter subunit IIB n=2 Tax=Roseisolibacter agri TaxID=2014610 RepID=A0AA37QJ20_9BACT|nr:PTS cellobiose transporter subunit IIB [Roseisolibacter agri]